MAAWLILDLHSIRPHSQSCLKYQPIVLAYFSLSLADRLPVVPCLFLPPKSTPGATLVSLKGYKLIHTSGT